MKPIIFMGAVFLSASSVFAQAGLQRTEHCTVVDQDGTLNLWACRNSEDKIRCYADVRFDDGKTARVWGDCVKSFQDCWWNGDSRVDACE